MAQTPANGSIKEVLAGQRLNVDSGRWLRRLQEVPPHDVEAALALGEHASHLIRRYWQSHISFSFPRLRPACGVPAAEFPHLLTDRNLVQMMLALRLCFAEAGLVLCTRECPELRDHLLALGITRLSAGSRTSPGGYSASKTGLQRFEVDDPRSPLEVAAMLKKMGFGPVWKDWDPAFQGARVGETPLSRPLGGAGNAVECSTFEIFSEKRG